MAFCAAWPYVMGAETVSCACLLADIVIMDPVLALCCWCADMADALATSPWWKDLDEGRALRDHP